MINLYVDSHLFGHLFKLFKKNKPGTSDYQRIRKVEDFFRSGGRLILDDKIKRDQHLRHSLNELTQGSNQNEKPKFDNFSDKIVEKAKAWSVFLLYSKNGINSQSEKSFLTANEANFLESLKKLLFIFENQVTHFRIIPEKILNKIYKTESSQLFEGWQSFSDEKLCSLSDVVIVDPYFLKPVFFDNNHGKGEPDYNFSEYVEKCLFPFFKILIDYAGYKNFAVTVFTMRNAHDDKNAEELIRAINHMIQKEELPINFSLVLSKKLYDHKRYMYTGYFGIDFGFSIHHYLENSVSGNNEEAMSIFPYAIDVNFIKHNNDLESLSELKLKVSDKGTMILPRGVSINNRLLDDSFTDSQKVSLKE
jgi:hypothetical protein